MKLPFKLPRWFVVVIQLLQLSPAAIFAYLVTIVPKSQPELQVAVAALAILFVAIGLANGYQIQQSRETADIVRKLDELQKTAGRLEKLQNDIVSEQQRQPNAYSPIVTSMTAMSQLLEFFTKKKEERGETDEKS